MSVLVLMYHGVERRPGPLFVEPAAFEEHLEVIAASGLPVLTVGEVGERLRGDTLPPRALCLTFDDGFASVTSEAAPRLAASGLRATVFCVAGRLGGTNGWPSGRTGGEPVPLADAADLAGLAAAGIEIGGHGMQHEPLDTDDRDVIRVEVDDGRHVLEDVVGVSVTSFAYPYGAAPSAAAQRAVADSYRTACTTRIGRVTPSSSPLALERVDAHYVRSPERLAAALAGRSDLYLAARRGAAAARRRVRRDYLRRP